MSDRIPEYIRTGNDEVREYHGDDARALNWRESESLRKRVSDAQRSAEERGKYWVDLSDRFQDRLDALADAWEGDWEPAQDVDAEIERILGK